MEKRGRTLKIFVSQGKINLFFSCKNLQKKLHPNKVTLIIIKNELISQGYTNKEGSSLFGGSQVSMLAQCMLFGQISSLARI